MRRVILLLTLGVAMVLAFSGVVLAQQTGSDPSPSSSAEDFVSGEILVKFKSGTSKAARDETHRQQGTQVKENLRKSGSQVAPDIQVVEVSPGDEETKSEEYKRDKKVEYAEPNFLYQPLATTANDTDFANLYGLNNTGQTVNGVAGSSDSDIDAPEAWDSAAGGNTGLADTVVAVIDTGVDVNHPELDGNIWKNPGESGTDTSGNDKATNGIDDDGNTFVDDVNGWDFFRNENTVYDAADGDTHGTHVAGSIAAEGNNGAGVVGVNWKAQIMPLKFLGPNGGSTANAIKALDYAVTKGAKISNNSWGGGGYSQALKDALTNADNKGHLFMAAAGNSGGNNDSYPSYPASYDNPNIVAVAATDSKDALASFSNYGATSVDLAAPGVYTYSTLPGNTYGYKSGTSMATPHVTGVAALIKSKDSNLDDAQVKTKLLGSVDKKSNLSGKVATGGRLNAATPLGIDVTPPTVSSVSPTDGKTGVGRSTNVTATFSEKVSSSSVNTSTFILVKGTRSTKPDKTSQTGIAEGTTVTYDASTKKATLNPFGSYNKNLDACTWYMTKVTTGVTDEANNPAVEKVWYFKTSGC